MRQVRVGNYTIGQYFTLSLSPEQLPNMSQICQLSSHYPGPSQEPAPSPAPAPAPSAWQQKQRRLLASVHCLLLLRAVTTVRQMIHYSYMYHMYGWCVHSHEPSQHLDTAQWPPVEPESKQQQKQKAQNRSVPHFACTIWQTKQKQRPANVNVNVVKTKHR